MQRHSTNDLWLYVNGSAFGDWPIARMSSWCASRGAVTTAREGRFDYLLVGSTGGSEPPPAAETRLGRRTALTFPLFPPPQKN